MRVEIGLFGDKEGGWRGAQFGSNAFFLPHSGGPLYSLSSFVSGSGGCALQKIAVY